MRRMALLMALAACLSACGAEDEQSPSSGLTAAQRPAKQPSLAQRLQDACQAPVSDVAVRPAGYLRADFDRYVVTCQNGSVRVVDDK